RGAAVARGGRTGESEVESHAPGRRGRPRGEGGAPGAIVRGDRGRTTHDDGAHGTRPALRGRSGPRVLQPPTGLGTPTNRRSGRRGRNRRRSIRRGGPVRHPDRETTSAQNRSRVRRESRRGRVAPRERRRQPDPPSRLARERGTPK